MTIDLYCRECGEFDREALAAPACNPPSGAPEVPVGRVGDVLLPD